MATITVMKDETGRLVGFSEKDKRAYAKFRKAVDELEPGECYTLSVWFPRNPKLHKLHFAVINALFERQEQFEDPEPLRKWLYVGAEHADFLPGPKCKMVAIPRSVAYHEIDDADFSDLHVAVLAFMRSQYCQRFLFSHLTEHQASEIVEGVLREFEVTTR